MAATLPGPPGHFANGLERRIGSTEPTEAAPSSACRWTDATFGFDKLPGKTATVGGKDRTAGQAGWTVTAGKRGQSSHKVLPPDGDTIEAAMAAVEKLYR